MWWLLAQNPVERPHRLHGYFGLIPTEKPVHSGIIFGYRRPTRSCQNLTRLENQVYLSTTVLKKAEIATSVHQNANEK